MTHLSGFRNLRQVSVWQRGLDHVKAAYRTGGLPLQHWSGLKQALRRRAAKKPVGLAGDVSKDRSGASDGVLVSDVQLRLASRLRSSLGRRNFRQELARGLLHAGTAGASGKSDQGTPLKSYQRGADFAQAATQSTLGWRGWLRRTWLARKKPEKSYPATLPSLSGHGKDGLRILTRNLSTGTRNQIDGEAAEPDGVFRQWQQFRDSLAAKAKTYRDTELQAARDALAEKLAAREARSARTQLYRPATVVKDMLRDIDNTMQNKPPRETLD